MELIDQIFIKVLGFATTTKDCCIYNKKIKGHIILLLRQVDDFWVPPEIYYILLKSKISIYNSSAILLFL